jgi:hypothetical protein
MVTVDEIRARVEAADKLRIQARADAAANVAEGAERRATVARELAELDAALAADVAAAEKVMTMVELVDFTGLSEHDLAGAGAAGRGRPSRRRAASGARTPRSRRTPAAGTADAADSPAD